MLSPKVYSFFCACFAALGAAVFGYDLGVIAYVIEAPDFLRVTGLTEKTKENENYIAFIVSIMLLGAFVSAVPAGLASDYFSRRAAITGGSLVFIIGGILQTAANNKETMMAGRFFAGLGIGALAALAPVYNSEIAAPAARGRMLATFQFFIGIGAFVAGWISYGCVQHSYGTALHWRLPLAFQMAPAIPLVFVTLLLPESPRWLMIKGREEESLQALAKLHANGNTEDAFVRGEYEEMRQKVIEEASVNQGWGQIFGDTTNFRKLALAFILQFSVQMTGVSAIQYYSPRVFASVGFSTDTTFLITSINNAMGLVGQMMCIAFLDKTGRRWVMILGNASAGALFAGAASLARKFVVGTGTRGDGIAFVAIIYIYNIIFSACIGPLSWVYPAEITNTAIRAKVVALSSMAAWIANFMIGQVSPIAFTEIGWRYYLVFTVCGFTNALVFWLFYPETKGYTLEMMDERFKTMNPIVPLDRSHAPRPKDTENQLAAVGAATSNVRDDKSAEVEHRGSH